MKKVLVFSLAALLLHLTTEAQTKKVKTTPKYDTIIRLRAPKPEKKTPVKPQEVVIPVPEYINQPYYYDKAENKLTRLESTIAQMVTRKKSLGLKGAKQILTMEGASSKIRFTAKPGLTFIIKTSGDVIDLTSYIKLYQFFSDGKQREVVITSKEGLITNNDDNKGKQVGFSVKMISKDNYMIQFNEALAAGEYAFAWVKNMELQEFSVHAFAIDWKNSD